MAGENGFLYVLDSWPANTLQKRDLLTYALLDTIGTSPFGSGDDDFDTSFYGPTSICTDGTYIYVADGNNARIKKHRADDLSFVQKTVSAGYYSPSGICYDAGKIYFQDWGNDRIVVLDANDLTVELGNFTMSQSGAVRDPGAMLEPSGLTTDGINLYSCDFTDFWAAPPNDWQSPIMKLTLANSPAFIAEYLPHNSSTYPIGNDEDQVSGICVGLVSMVDSCASRFG